MTPKEILIAARKLIEKPECWTQGALARTQNGDPIGVSGIDEKNTVCFCALGAVYRVAGARHDCATHYLKGAIGRATGGNPLAFFNDTHTHAEVLAAFDRAIASAA